MNSLVQSPRYEARPVLERLHGIEVEDRFRWLEDQNAPETRCFIETEQRIYREYLLAHSKLRNRIAARVRDLLTVEKVDCPVPDRRGGLLYLKRRSDQEQKAVYHQAVTGEEKMVLTASQLAPNDHLLSVAILTVSKNGRYFAFGVRKGGEDFQEIGIFDLESEKILPDRLPAGLFRGLVFDPDGSGFYYVQEEFHGRYNTRRAVRRHFLGHKQTGDEEIFNVGDEPGIRLILRDSEDNSSLGYLIQSLECAFKVSFLIHRFPLKEPPISVVSLTRESFGVRFSARTILALTSYRAPRGRIVSIPPASPGPDHWIDVITPGRGRFCSFDWVGGHIVAHGADGTRKFSDVYSMTGRLVRRFHFPASGTTIVGQTDLVNNRFFYSHSDVTSPPALYEANLITGRTALWWKQIAIHSWTNPMVEEHRYCSGDRTEIPITLVRPTRRRNPGPVLLSAYGGGGISNTARFSAFSMLLLEAGIDCAIAHVRGGGERGAHWHHAALGKRKQVSVDDLIAAAEWLIESRYTTPNRLAVAGQSHGALLALCAMVQRPDLFRAVLALGPITDLTRFHRFGPARGFVVELGSPDDPEQFESLLRLSPYHGLCAGRSYPSVLIISGGRDRRCDSLHARKMIARLREASLKGESMLLDYTEHRGHKPVLPLSDRIKSLTDRATFLVAELSDTLREDGKNE